jgi:hypothetical protein
MPRSIANVSVSANSFTIGLFLGLCITRIVFFLRFFDFCLSLCRGVSAGQHRTFCGALAVDAM